MRFQIKNVVPSTLLTILFLIILEVLSTAMLPMIGVSKYRLPFNILIILFLGFKLETSFLAILILVVQYTHAFFSIEGWASGTIAGIIVCTIISYLRDLMHFSSAGFTMLVTQLFQLVWFLIISVFFYIRFDNVEFLIEKFWRFIPESICISLLSPLFFALLDKIWKVREDGVLSDES